jgi:hypothetical protein
MERMGAWRGHPSGHDRESSYESDDGESLARHC